MAKEIQKIPVKRFVIDTKVSQFEPIETEINGKVYKIDIITPLMLKDLKKYEDLAATGDMDAIMKQVEILGGIPKKVCENLDVRHLKGMLNYLSDRVFNAEKYEEPSSKNDSGIVEENIPQ